MSLRQDLFDALSDPGRLQRVREGAVNDAAFASRLLRDVGATWVHEMQEWQSLLGCLAQYGWRPGGLAAAAFFYDESGACGFVQRITPDATRFRPIDFGAEEHEWRAPLKSRNGLRFLAAPG